MTITQDHQAVSGQSVSRIEVPRCDLDGETVLFQPADGSYFGLNAVSSRIWDHLEQPTTIEQICLALEAEFQVSPDLCRQETAAFMLRLEAADLLRRGEISHSLNQRKERATFKALDIKMKRTWISPDITKLDIKETATHPIGS